MVPSVGRCGRSLFGRFLVGLAVAVLVLAGLGQVTCLVGLTVEAL